MIAKVNCSEYGKICGISPLDKELYGSEEIKCCSPCPYPEGTKVCSYDKTKIYECVKDYQLKLAETCPDGKICFVDINNNAVCI
ncbi:MAG: hypothetical protein QW727_00790 [Candidatus Pacearchaeota archaeon]